MRADGAKIGLTTVYRALQALADTGQVDVLRTDDGESVYRACASGDHHHHLVCRRVRPYGRGGRARRGALGRDGRRRARLHATITHTVEVFGTCASCSARASGGLSRSRGARALQRGERERDGGIRVARDPVPAPAPTPE